MTKVKDLSPLKGMPIEEINFSGTDVKSVEPLGQSNRLRIVEMRATKVDDLSHLSECPIKKLILPGSKVHSISCLRYSPVKILNLVGIQLSDYNVLRSMPLEKLSISPDLLPANGLDLIMNLDLQYLLGPGDRDDQTKEQFLAKYCKIIETA